MPKTDKYYINYFNSMRPRNKSKHYLKETHIFNWNSKLKIKLNKYQPQHSRTNLISICSISMVQLCGLFAYFLKDIYNST